MDNLFFCLNATGPIFLMMILGLFFRHIGWMDEEFASKMNKFVFKVPLPLLLFGDLATVDFSKVWNVKFVIFCFIVTLICIIISAGISCLWKDKSIRGEFIQASYRSSAALLGIAFIQNIYGTAQMAPLMIIGSVPLYNIFAVIILTLESNSAQKQDTTLRIKTACIGILKNPIIIGIFLGLVASFFNVSLPHMLDKTIQNLSVMASPLALISIGASFEGRKAIAKIKPTLAASFIKLAGLAAIFLPIAIYLGFRDQKLIAIIIMLASPCTPTSYIMAKNLDNDATLASSIVVMTTLLSSLTLTGWIFLTRLMQLIQ